jgi:peroxiredoxin Q/BCP
MKLKNNIKAPNFKLPSTNKTIFELNKIKKKNIILYFYPKDDTPGCTIESKDFSKLNNLISKNNSIVLGISKDSIESHLKFIKKYKLKFNLLSDEKLLVIKKYGVWGKKSFLGKKYMGVVRTTFLIDAKGKIRKIWSNVRVKDHAKEVYSELKKIV